MQARQFSVDGPGSRTISPERGFTQLGHGRGRNIGGDRDDPVATKQHELASCGIVTAVEGKIVPGKGADGSHTIQVAGSFLHSDDIVHPGQATHGFWQHVTGGPAGHIVQNLGDVHGFGNGLVMQIQAFLGGLVVIGGHQQAGIRTCLGSTAGKADGFGGGVGAGTGHDGNAARNMLYGKADHPAVFLLVECGRFPRGTHGNDSARPLIHVPVQQFVQRVPVDRTIRRHRCHQRYHTTLNHHSLHSSHRNIDSDIPHKSGILSCGNFR